MCGDIQISSSELKKITERLSARDAQTGKMGFEMQLHVRIKENTQGNIDYIFYYSIDKAYT